MHCRSLSETGIAALEQIPFRGRVSGAKQLPGHPVRHFSRLGFCKFLIPNRPFLGAGHSIRLGVAGRLRGSSATSSTTSFLAEAAAAPTSFLLIFACFSITAIEAFVLPASRLGARTFGHRLNSRATGGGSLGASTVKAEFRRSTGCRYLMAWQVRKHQKRPAPAAGSTL